MKQLSLTGKLACALIVTAAAVSGCKKKEVDNTTTPEPTPATTPTPAPAPAPA